MSKKNIISLVAVPGFLGILVATVAVIKKLSGEYELFMFSVPLGLMLGFAWMMFLNKKLLETENKAPEKKVTPTEDPFIVFELIDKREREKYPENIRSITWNDIKEKAKIRQTEIYSSSKSFGEEKELIDLAVKMFSNRDNIANVPSYVAKAALKLIGYDEEIVPQLYEMLYNESTRVYNVLRP